MFPPLYTTPPGGGDAFWLTTPDNVRLRAAFWRATDHRGTIMLCHGRSEFIEKYYAVIARFLAMGLSVMTFDWRGQGLSDRLLEERLPGYVDSFASYQHDLRAAFSALEERAEGPVILVAHSMGGCIATRYLSAPKQAIKGAIVTAPMYDLMLPTMAVPALRAISWSIAHWRLGKYRINPGEVRTAADWPFEDNVLTHSREEFDRYADLVRAYPDLALGGVTWAWLDAAFREMRDIRELPENSIEIPTLMLTARHDGLVSVEAIEAFAARNEAIRLVHLDDCRHEPFMETDAVQQTLWSEIQMFMTAITPIGTTGPSLPIS